MKKIDTLSIKNLISKTKNLTILDREDNEASRVQTHKALSNFFDNIDIAIDGKDGLDQYKEKSNTYYDLIISDINMPNMNGIDMAKEILKINNMQKIIMITAYNSENLQELSEIGITNYIHKPVKMSILMNVMEKIL